MQKSNILSPSQLTTKVKRRPDPLFTAGSVILNFAYFYAATPEYPKGQMNPAAYPMMAFTNALIIIVAIWLSAYGTRREIPYLPKAPPTTGPFRLTRMLGNIWQALGNKSFRYLFFGAILPPPLISMSPIILRMTHILPENSDPALLPILMIIVGLTTFCSSQALVTTGSLIADISDEHELTSGRREEGIFFGANAFIHKSVYGLGVTIAGFGLDIINFPAKAKPGLVDPGIVTNLGILFGVVPAFAGLIAAWFYLRIGINRQSHAKTMAELAFHREKKETEGD